jgi:ABC-type nitrate/sulfonate/bicarbonate transport system ATPase subunit
MQDLYGAVELGLLYALMALGVFITFRILNFPDLTVDGSFATGGAVAAVLISNGYSPWLATIVAFVSGLAAGACTGLLHTKGKVNGLLSGILMTEDRMRAKVGLLSGGERQALSLLMATFTQPEILLLDEHTAALDPSRAELITRLTEEIVCQQQLTTLMVTHNMEQAIRLGNRLIMMDKGRIILDISEERKQDLTVERLLGEFERISGHKLSDDRIVLHP